MSALNHVKRTLAVATTVAATVLGGAMLMTATTSANAAEPGDQVCAGLDSGKIDTPANPTELTITAPEGMLIDQYCVKAGSANSGDGPVYVDVDPPVAEITISYPGGKELSHYSVSYTTETTPTEPTTEPTTPTEPTTEPTTAPTTDVTVSPSEATSTPTNDVEEPSEEPSVAGEEAEVPSEVAAGLNGDQSSAVPGGTTTLGVLGLLTAILGAALVGASVAARKRA